MPISATWPGLAALWLSLASVLMAESEVCALCVMCHGPRPSLSHNHHPDVLAAPLEWLGFPTLTRLSLGVKNLICGFYFILGLVFSLFIKFLDTAVAYDVSLA